VCIRACTVVLVMWSEVNDHYYSATHATHCVWLFYLTGQKYHPCHSLCTSILPDSSKMPPKCHSLCISILTDRRKCQLAVYGYSTLQVHVALRVIKSTIIEINEPWNLLVGYNIYFWCGFCMQWWFTKSSMII
jgi:hypothetical protein